MYISYDMENLSVNFIFSESGLARVREFSIYVASVSSANKELILD